MDLTPVTSSGKEVAAAIEMLPKKKCPNPSFGTITSPDWSKKILEQKRMPEEIKYRIKISKSHPPYFRISEQKMDCGLISNQTEA